MESVKIAKRWNGPVRYVTTVVGLTIVAALVIKVFPAVNDLVWMLLGMTAAKLDMAERERNKPKVQHLKRGTTYNVLGKARIQTEWPVVDNVELTVYQGTDDGKMWARPTDEFEDGRFVKVET